MRIIVVLYLASTAVVTAADVEGVELDTTPAFTLEEAVVQSMNIFLGRVIRLEGDDIAVFEVDKEYKGDLSDEAKVTREYQAYSIEGWLEDLNYPFFKGKRYVIFAAQANEFYLPYYSTNIQWTIARVEGDKVCMEKFRDHEKTWFKLSKFGWEVKKIK
ncbi:MAG: hypothetical protein GY771_16730 [bacterium]|nr:hypothetical protein [bacterium]